MIRMLEHDGQTGEHGQNLMVRAISGPQFCIQSNIVCSRPLQMLKSSFLFQSRWYFQGEASAPAECGLCDGGDGVLDEERFWVETSRSFWG